MHTSALDYLAYLTLGAIGLWVLGLILIAAFRVVRWLLSRVARVDRK